ncbi:arrestin [Colletotrichum tofieldiae]|nr:arrestin [Colletotrichum tofieldiae]
MQGGQHEFPFTFKLPINNACSDPVAMSKIGGIGGMGRFGAGIGPFGLGGARVMDGSKQLFLQHVTKTLPPSFTGFPRQAEVRYYLKVTIQRPGFLKENWRYQIGFKFMPIEPPRPPKTTQEAFARRPFTFKPRAQGLQKKKSSLFGSGKDDSATADSAAVPPSIELSARLPHPPILTCNQPLPLRLIAKKLVPSHEQVFLTSIQIELVGKTHVRCHDLFNTEVSKWVVVTQTGLSVPILKDPASDDLSLESVIPDDLWRSVPLPNTVAPSFVACNLQRHYELDIQLGLPRGFLSSSKDNPAAQTIFLPLHFSKVQIYSGIAPPPQLLEALAAQASRPGAATLSVPPRLPRGRRNRHAGAAGFDEAPPSYDEAMAADASGPEERPAYSGVTNENAPSQIPEKS